LTTHIPVTVEVNPRHGGPPLPLDCALIPDNQVCYGVPFGGVVAYKDAISPTEVSYDIGCGNEAILLDMKGAELLANISTMMDDIWNIISCGVGRKNNERVDHPIFSNGHAGWDVPAARSLKQKAEAQLWTIGSGNHYGDLFTDESDWVQVGVHFRLRGFGPGIATRFLKAAGVQDGMDMDTAFCRCSDLGSRYLAAMELTGEYSYAGRSWVCDRVVRLVGADVLVGECDQNDGTGTVAQGKYRFAGLRPRRLAVQILTGLCPVGPLVPLELGDLLVRLLGRGGRCFQVLGHRPMVNSELPGNGPVAVALVLAREDGAAYMQRKPHYVAGGIVFGLV